MILKITCNDIKYHMTLITILNVVVVVVNHVGDVGSRITYSFHLII